MRMSDVDICNTSLALLGSTDFIQLLTDTDSVWARRCNQFFKSSVELVLREHDWHCATHSAELARNTSGPASKEYTYSYALPTDCVRVIDVLGAEDYSPYDRWRIAKRNVITDLGTCYLKYVQMPEDYKTLDVILAETIAYKLSLRLAASYIKDKEMYQILNYAYNDTLKRAKAADTLENQEAFTENDRYEDARLSV